MARTVTSTQSVEGSVPAGAAVSVNLTWLTWERLILGVVLAIGAGLRFYRLDLHPLSTLEAGYAWTAWRLAQGLDPVWGGANPLFLSLQTFLFWLTGGGDFWARLLGACAGLATVVLVLRWRAWLGPAATLLLAVFLALSPWHVAASRMGDGGAIALFLGLLAMTLLQGHLAGSTLDERLDSHAGEADLKTTAKRSDLRCTEETENDSPSIFRLYGILGLLVISGPVAWMFLPLFLGWFALERARIRPWVSAWRVGAPAFLAATVLGATGWLARFDGFGGISTSFSVWLSRFGPTVVETTDSLIPYRNAVGGDMGWTLWRISADQPMLTLFGIAGLCTAWWFHRSGHGRPLNHLRLLTLWTLTGSAWLLLPGRDVHALAFFAVPIYVCAAWLMARVLQQRPTEVDPVEMGSVGVTLLILATAGWIWMTGLLASLLFDIVLIQALIAIVGLVILLVALYAYWAGWPALRRLFTAILMLLVIAGAIRSSASLNFANPGVAPSGIAHSVTHSGVRQMVTDLETLSAQRTGDPHKMFVFLDPGLLSTSPVRAVGRPDIVTARRDVDDPVLAWYLRGFRNLSWPERARAPRPDEPMAYVTPLAVGAGSDSRTQISDAGTFAETQYPLRLLWLPQMPQRPVTDDISSQDRLQLTWRTVWRPVLRWYIYREPALEPEYQFVRLRLMVGAIP